jgi:hypothetical protein
MDSPARGKKKAALLSSTHAHTLVNSDGFVKHDFGATAPQTVWWWAANRGSI